MDELPLAFGKKPARKQPEQRGQEVSANPAVPLSRDDARLDPVESAPAPDEDDGENALADGYEAPDSGADIPASHELVMKGHQKVCLVFRQSCVADRETVRQFPL